MNKAYFIAPLIAVIVFGGFYSSHQSGAKAREADRVAKVDAKLKAKQADELAAKKLAMADAIQAAESRKKEREAKEAKEKADKEVRALAIDTREKAFREQEKSNKLIDRLKKDIALEEASISSLVATRKESEAEKAFLLDFVTKSQANVQALQALMTKLNTPPPAAIAAK
jgi:flagellar biosynthesis GTPase FlhF